MSNEVPVLDTERVMHFISVEDFREALRSVTDGQWIMAAPKVQLKLHTEVPIVLKLESREEEIQAIAVPMYWRGPFVGLQVRAPSAEGKNLAEQLLQRLQFEEDSKVVVPSELKDSSELMEQSVSEPAAAELDHDEELDEPTDPGMEQSVSEPAATELDHDEELDEPTDPGHEAPDLVVDDSSTDGASPAVQTQESAASEEAPIDWSEIADDDPDEAPAAPGKIRPPEPAVQQPAVPEQDVQPPAVPESPAQPLEAQAPASTPAVQNPKSLSGTINGPFSSDNLLTRFPLKGTGFSSENIDTIYQLISLLAANEATGVLELRDGETVFRIFLRKGVLLGIDPPDEPFDERFARQLLETESCDERKLEDAIAHAEAFEQSLPGVLYEKRVVPMDVMGRELRALKEKLVSDLLLSENLWNYRFAVVPRFKQKFDPMRIHMVSALVEFVKGFLANKYAAHLEPILEPYRFKFAQNCDNALVPVEVLYLNDKQKHAIMYVFNGPNRLNEVYSLCLLTRHGTARLVMLLHHFRLLTWSDKPAAFEGQESIEHRLERTLNDVLSHDHFDRLEVHWGAHPKKLEMAVLRFKKKYGPERPLAKHSDEARALCERILEKVYESSEFLSNKRQRREYRLEQQGDQRVRRAAEFLVKQADLVRFRAEWDAAFELLEAAIDMHEHPSYVSRHKQWRSDRASGKN
jgi:hypothetical protein